MKQPKNNEWICRSCFDSQPHECSCGNPSYDPDASESESDEDNSVVWSDDEDDGFDEAEARAEEQAIADYYHDWDDDVYAWYDNQW